MIKGTVTMSAVPDRKPKTDCFMLFKVASLKNIQSLQKGLLYLNSLAYFSQNQEKDIQSLRFDSHEQSYLRLSSGSDLKGRRELAIEIDGKEYPLGPESILHLTMPKPEETMIFSMGCLAESQPEFQASGEFGTIKLSNRFIEFGTHALKIDDRREFFQRLGNALSSHPHLYNSDFFEGGHGQVEYLEMDDYNGPLGAFRKPKSYDWQREYRICIGAEKIAQNSKGALELNIGSLEDISTILTIDQLTTPINFKRGTITVKAKNLNES
ncbi:MULTISPECIES: hypothetical protein [Pseudomonas]|uniref:hypothetical protein n=1 Tax=Pseudomonas TaxID=286 RepID=UPI0020001264|nr:MULTISPECIES: hypothetical protein [Pseudomonas]MDD1981803.1 hypothetical protein [Pseudomonas asiatica]UPK88656.1 hypothetical protein E5221_28485 [Pseudomonas sp. A2]